MDKQNSFLDTAGELPAELVVVVVALAVVVAEGLVNIVLAQAADIVEAESVG